MLMRHPSEIRACIEGIRFQGFQGFLNTPIEFSLFGFFQRFNQTEIKLISRFLVKSSNILHSQNRQDDYLDY